MINTDIFIKKGEHPICQDYAISGVEPFPYVIISDGCSSSKNTDVGARILALSAKNFLIHPKDYFIHYFNNETDRGFNHNNLYKNMGLCIINKALSIVKLLSLELSCLDATLMISFIIDGIIHTYIYGDGDIIFVSPNGINYYSVSFPSSAPFYLSYYLDPSKMNDYFENFSDIKTKTKTTVNTDYSVSEDKKCKAPITYSHVIEPKTTILISSDGINSFVSNRGSKQLTKHFIPAMVSFKNFKGQFITRRFRRFVYNMSKNGVNHFDDISVGGFHAE